MVFFFFVVVGFMKTRTVIEEKGTKEGKGTVAGTEINLFPQSVSLFHLFWWVVPLLHGPSCRYEGRKGATITSGLFWCRVGVKVNVTGHHFGDIFEDYTSLSTRKRTQSCNSSQGTDPPGSVLLHDKWKHFLVMSSTRLYRFHDAFNRTSSLSETHMPHEAKPQERPANQMQLIQLKGTKYLCWYDRGNSCWCFRKIFAQYFSHAWAKPEWVMANNQAAQTIWKITPLSSNHHIIFSLASRYLCVARPCFSVNPSIQSVRHCQVLSQYRWAAQAYAAPPLTARQAR